MAEYILYPESDDKADGTEVPAGAAWPLLRDSASEVGAPGDLTNYIEFTGVGISRHNCQNIIPLDAGEDIVSVTAYFYARMAVGQTAELSMLLPSEPSTTATIPDGSAYGWYSVASTVAAVESDVNAMKTQFNVSGTASSSTTRLAAVFVRVVTDKVPFAAPAGYFSPQLLPKAWF
jgi:hypothetical protein